MLFIYDVPLETDFRSDVYQVAAIPAQSHEVWISAEHVREYDLAKA
jgi:hypothetical protein